jgi:prevent-host-death family protein
MALARASEMIFLCLTMKTASVADLRNRFPSVFRWIEDGETVELTKRGRVVARIVPAPAAKPRKFKMPDFAARSREIMGGNPKIYPSIVDEERSTYQW